MHMCITRPGLVKNNISLSISTNILSTWKGQAAVYNITRHHVKRHRLYTLLAKKVVTPRDDVSFVIISISSVREV